MQGKLKDLARQFIAGYVTSSVQYKELKSGSHSGHAKTNLSGHCVKMSGHYFLKVTPILKYMIWYNVANKILNLSPSSHPTPTCLARSPPQNH